jgi:plastocyanin
MSSIRDNIYSDIASQFPTVYKENSEFFIAFVEAYYKYLDEKMDRDIPKLRDIDTTLPAFFIYYKKKYLADLPINTSVNVPFIIKHIDDLYTRKGTKESLELLFKMFFNEEINVFYPGGSILKPSNTIWGGEEFLEMKEVFDVEGYPIQRGNTIKGDLSGAEAFVDDIVFVNFSGSLTPILYMSNLKGVFVGDDSLEVISATNDGTETIINVGKLISGSISDTEVSKAIRLPNQRHGDRIDLVSKSSGVGGKAIITKASETQVGSIDYEIIDGGYGYIKPNTTGFNDQSVEISNQVIILNGEERTDIQKGKTITFPGSTIEYDGRDETLAQQYSITGSGVITEYRHPLLFIETKTDLPEFFNLMTEYYQASNSQGQLVFKNLLFDSFVNSFWEKVGNDENMLNIPVEKSKFFKFLQQPVEPRDKYGQGSYSNFVGAQENSMNDITAIEESFLGISQDINLAEIDFFQTFQNSINNGIDDVEFYSAPTDQDNWLTLSQFGGVSEDLIAQLENEAGDRLPTVAPIIDHLTFSSGMDNGYVDELHSGQVYTIIHPGNIMTDDDFAKIGASSSVAGTDFTFTDANLGNLSRGSDLSKYDATFSAAKQSISKFLKFLQEIDVFQNVTIGTILRRPITTVPELVSAEYPYDDLPEGSAHPLAGQPDYSAFNIYYTPAPNLVKGRTYHIRNIGTTTFAEWTSAFPDLLTATDTVNSTQKAFNVPVITSDGKHPLRDYFIQDLGDSDADEWTLLGWRANQNGAGDTPAVGDRYIANDDQFKLEITEASAGSHYIAGDDSYDATGVISENNPTIKMRTGDTFTINNALHAQHPVEIRLVIESTEDGTTGVAATTGVSGAGTNSVSFTPTSAGTYYYQCENHENMYGVIEVSTISGTGKVINITNLINQTGTIFNFEYSGTPITGTGYCADHRNIYAGDPGDSTTRYRHTGGGLFVDPVRDASNNPINTLPSGLTNTSFLGFLDGHYFQPIDCRSISPYNATSSFSITDVTDTELVRLNTDIIGDHFKEVLESRLSFDSTNVDTANNRLIIENHQQAEIKSKHQFTDGNNGVPGTIVGLDTDDFAYVKVIDEDTLELYETRSGNGTTSSPYVYSDQVTFSSATGGGFQLYAQQPSAVATEFYDQIYNTSGNLGVENIDTTYEDAFSEVTFTIGSVSSILEDNPGINYQNDVGVRIFNEVIAGYDLKDLIITFDNAPFTLQPNEIVTQTIRSPYEGPVTDTEADYVNGVLVDPDESIGALFDRSVDVNGLKIAVGRSRDKFGNLIVTNSNFVIPDEFSLKVAKVAELMVDPTASGINTQAQRKMIGVIRGDYGTPHADKQTALQIIYSSPDSYFSDFTETTGDAPGFANYNGYETFLNTHAVEEYPNGFIRYPSQSIGDRQIEEVLGSLIRIMHLHAIPGVIDGSDSAINFDPVGLSEQWQTTELFKAMKEAIDADKYIPTDANLDPLGSPADAKVALKEYLYFLNWGMWSLSEFWGSSKTANWTDDMLTPSGIESNNPLGYELFNKYINPILSRPNFIQLRSIFQDNNAGVSGYINTPVTSYLTASEVRDLPASTRLTVDSTFNYEESVTSFELLEEKYDVRMKFLKRVGTEFYFRPVSFFGVDQNAPITIRAEDRKILTIRKDQESLPMGANAQVLGAAEYSTGQVEEIKVLHTGYKYKDGEMVDLVNIEEDSPTYNQVVATAKISANGQGSTEGRWKDTSSFLNESSAIVHDNNYYQEYSYDISTMIDPEIFTPLVKDVVGVAGTKMFHTPLINSENSFESNVDVDIVTFDVVLEPFIAEGTGFVGDPTGSLEAGPEGSEVGLLVTETTGEQLISVSTEEDETIV